MIKAEYSYQKPCNKLDPQDFMYESLTGFKGICIFNCVTLNMFPATNLQHTQRVKYIKATQGEVHMQKLSDATE